MTQRPYNRFDIGIKQDNTAIFSSSASFIYSNNLDGLKDGQGITLGPKINKLLLTTNPIRGIDMPSGSVVSDTNILGGDNGDIYKFTSTDNTPEYTISGQNIIFISEFGNDYIIFTKSDLTFENINIYKISKSDFLNGIFTSLSSPLLTSVIIHYGIPPVLTIGSDMFIGGNGYIKQFDGSTITNTYNFPDSYVNGLTLQGSTIAVYTRTGKTFFWDGGSTNESARGEVGARISKAVSKSGRDFITSEDGQLKTASYTQSQRLFKPKTSYRLEDNSILSTKLNFTLDDTNNLQNHTGIVALDDLYFYGSDTIKGIYKYGNLIPGTSNGIHKIVTQNHQGTQIDTIYDMYYYDKTVNRIYFSYKAGTIYGVDYIELDQLESCNTGYGITEILTGGTSFKKKLNVVRVSISNIDANKTANIYYRVNNQGWVLLRTINTTTEDIYYRNNIYFEADGQSFKEFIDIQFKVELNSSTNDDKPPMLNELIVDYSIIES